MLMSTAAVLPDLKSAFLLVSRWILEAIEFMKQAVGLALHAGDIVVVFKRNVYGAKIVFRQKCFLNDQRRTLQ
jgi:hypothetical protein